MRRDLLAATTTLLAATTTLLAATMIVLSLQGGLDNGTASAIHVDGDVYVGGSFTSVSGVSVLRIAKWNGTWSSLGTAPTNGVDAVVRAIAVRNGIVYVGGDFTNAAGRVVNSIARGMEPTGVPLAADWTCIRAV